MNLRSIILGLAAAVVLAAGAAAQDAPSREGPYVSGQFGFNALADSDVSGSGVSESIEFEGGLGAVFAAGYAFGNGFRAEGEVAFRRNDAEDVSGTAASGDAESHAFMVNALYDFDVGGALVPYAGLGAGFARVKMSRVSPLGGGTLSEGDLVPAWQAIVGAAVPLGAGAELTADYRYFQTADPALTLSTGTAVDAEYRAHSFLVGLRWRFGTPARRPVPAAAPPPPEPTAAPEPAPKPEPEAAPAPEPEPLPRSYLVFFDWDRADIRPDARVVLERAAANARKAGFARVRLTGHADRSGPAAYNVGLSRRRAESVREILVSLGIPAEAISLIAKGESEPLVPTADGVREPRNRRVEIVY